MSQNEDRMKAELAALQPADGTMHVVRRLRRAFLSICRCGDVMFSPYRLTTEQYALMRAVQRDPGIRQVDLTDRIFAEPNTVTAMVSLLERRGILRRRPSPSDRRARLLFLTTHGQAVMKRLSDDWEPMRALLRKCFSGEAGQEALEILDAVYSEMTRERENLLRKATADHRIELDLQEMEDEELRTASRIGRGKSSQSSVSRPRSPKQAKSRAKAKSEA